MAGLAVLVLSGCASPFSPSVHPTRLTLANRIEDSRAVDLDGDGRDELVRRGYTTKSGEKVPQSILIQALTGRAVAQVNFPGRVTNVEFADLTQDGRLELVAPVVTGDSLFYGVVNAEGEKLHQLFVVSGTPRQEPWGSIAWDPRKSSLRLADVTGDGRKELISFLTTGFARQPRGVWVHTYPEGEQVGHQRIGAMTRYPTYFGNVDEDPHPEWLFGSKATNNGAEAAGMRDDKAYLGAIEVRTNPRVQWSRELGETFSGAALSYGDLDGDGTTEFVGLRKPRAGRRMASPLLQIDPATGDTRQRFRSTAILQEVNVAGVGPGQKERVVVRDAEGTIRVLDSAFDVRHRRTFEISLRRMSVLPDVTGDGREELFLRTEKGTLWLRPDLSVRASTPHTGGIQLIKTGTGQQPRIGVSAQEGDMILLRIVEHPWWWVYRYGPISGFVLLGIGVLAGGVFGWRWYRRAQLREAVRRQVAKRSDQEWVLVTPRGQIGATSSGLAQVLGLDEPSTVDRDALRAHCPALYDYIGALRREPTSPQATEIMIEGRSFTVTNIPLTEVDGPYWLVWLRPSGLTADGSSGAGRLVVERVAHDLKNPLTSILLTLQRLQMEYWETVPDAAEDLDAYTERIEERVASLRRMTTNVLKIVGKEDLRRTSTDLSAFVDEVADTVAKDLPPDIELCLDLAEDLPVVSVDRDQIHSILENLVSNALEAMPEGGRITLTTRLERNLSFENTPPHDYVILEVLDTGTGMTPATRQRLFEPGFSTRDDTGLGLALVRKIIDDHGGHIDVNSERDVGTSITLYLPLTDEAGE